MGSSPRIGFGSRLSRNLNLLGLTEEEMAKSLEITVSDFRLLTQRKFVPGIPSRKIEILKCIAGSPEEPQEALLKRLTRGKIVLIKNTDPTTTRKYIRSTKAMSAKDFVSLIHQAAERLPRNLSHKKILALASKPDPDMFHAMKRIRPATSPRIPYSKTEMMEWKLRILSYAQDVQRGVY